MSAGSRRRLPPGRLPSTTLVVSLPALGLVPRVEPRQGGVCGRPSTSSGRGWCSRRESSRGSPEMATGRKNGGRDRDRTCDPSRVKGVRYRCATRPEGGLMRAGGRPCQGCATLQRHARGGGHPRHRAEHVRRLAWVPACAGMTVRSDTIAVLNPPSRTAPRPDRPDRQTPASRHGPARRGCWRALRPPRSICSRAPRSSSPTARGCGARR